MVAPKRGESVGKVSADESVTAGETAPRPNLATMNAYLRSLFVNLLTTLAGLGGLLASHGVIDAASAPVANAAAAQLVTPLGILLSLIATGLTHALVAWIGKRFPGLGKAMESGGFSVLLIGGLLLTVVGLPSCSSSQLAEYQMITGAVPVTIGAEYNGLQAVYSSKTGVSLIYDASGKPVGTVALPSAPTPVTPSIAPALSSGK